MVIFLGSSYAIYSSGFDEGYKKCELEYLKEWRLRSNELNEIRKDIKRQRKTVDSIKAIYRL